MLAGGDQFLAVLMSAFAVGCGGVSTDRVGVSDRFGDARTDAGGHSGSIDSAVVESDAPTTNRGDAANVHAEDATADGALGLCAPPSSTVPGVDAGKCLGIFYATIEHLVLFVDDASAPGGGTRVTLTQGGTKTVGGHSYGYAGNSLITSGSAADIHLDVDGRKDSLDFYLSGCAPTTGFRAWDYPATLTRTICTGCAPTSVARHYVVVEGAVDGGLDYTFTADEPPRTCGAGVDLLEFTTWPG